MKIVDTFTVCRRGVRVQVRLLPDVAAVDKYCREYEGRKRGNGHIVHGMFIPMQGGRQRCIGMIVLPATGGDLADIIPHEVTHAAMHRLQHVDANDDEPLAYTIGQLTRTIRARLRERGIAS